MTNIFQWIVDTTQKQPYWWIKQCVIIFILFNVMTVMLLPPNPRHLFLIVNLPHAAILWYVACNPYLLKSVFTPKWSSVMWFIVLLSLPIIMTKIDIEGILFLCRNLVIAFIYEFGMCKPPAPPKNKFSFNKLSPT